MRRPLLVCLTAAVVVLPLLGGTASAAPIGTEAAAVAFTPGAPGVGDPYFPLDGNGGYDVASYDLAIRYTPATDVLDGVATIRATATQDLSRFNLDLHGLTVRAVSVNGQPAAWARAGDELIVRPAAGLPTGSAITAVVRYGGIPETIVDQLGVSGFIHTDDGAVVAGEPGVAATWFPVNDHPSDKASYTFRITVPEGLTAVANGIPRGRSTRAGWTTWTWQASEPMASYLATATMGEFDLSTRIVDGITYVDAIDVDLVGTHTGNVASASLARAPEIIAFLAARFGPYPFSAAGGIVDDSRRLSFALENQTRPIYARSFFTGSRSGDSVVVHELAHQWYGDSVAVQAWKNIWLNEGFATYAEWSWSEDQGFQTADQIFAALYAIPSDDPFWRLKIGNPGPNHLFDDPVYGRGAMTLHALRQTIGDTDFYRLLPAWSRQQEAGNATTTEFIALAERISGRQLDGFFDEWLFTPAKPQLP